MVEALERKGLRQEIPRPVIRHSSRRGTQRLLSTQQGPSRCRCAVHEGTAVIEWLLTRPERKVER
jgi:hypothetical protein